MRLVDGEGRLLGRVNLLDGLVALFILTLIPVFGLFCGNLLRHSTLTLESVEPKRFVFGVDSVLTVLGNGFDGTTTFSIDDGPSETASSVNESRFDLYLREETAPGWHTLVARNGRGRKVWREEMVEILWRPTVRRIVRIGRTALWTTYRVEGRYFQNGCLVLVNGAPAEHVVHRSPSELLIEIQTPLAPAGWTQLTIQNPCAEAVALEGDALLARLDLDGAGLGSAPVITQILPRTIHTERETGFLILGDGFQEGCFAWVGSEPLREVWLLEPHIMMGVLPAHALAPGRHAVEVVHPSGKRAVVPDGVEVE